MRSLLLHVGLSFTVLVGFLVGCASRADKVAAGQGSDTATDTATAAFCAGAPELTWETYGHGFMATYCLACHSVDATSRFGAPADMNFDTVGETWSFKDEILVSVVETAAEPPGGGVYTEDRYNLEAWLRCAESGT